MLLRRHLAVEVLEDRRLLAILPAYVNGVFTLGDPTAAAPYGLENTFLLSSRPTATKTIYLDFTGHHSVGNSWNHNIVFPAFNTQGDPSTFTNAELAEIQQQFQHAVEDFLPFDVNVTTQEPPLDRLIKSSSGDQFYGVRSVQTQPTDGFGNGIGGVAYLNSFDDSLDNPVFVFNKGARNGGMTISHEVGHSLGLSHDGLNSTTYHPGTGTGPTGWGPIMGAPFGKNLVQWSKGDYTGATNTEDDLSIIIKPANGFGYRPDDHGNSTATATTLVNSSGTAFDWGIIERNTDLDFFTFTTGPSSNVTIQVNVFGQDPNLDTLLTVYDSSGNVLGTNNPSNLLTSSFNLSNPNGTYYLSVDGVGLPGRYSDYGSLGFFTVTVTGLTSVAIPGDVNGNGSLDIGDLDLLMENIYQATQGNPNPNQFDFTGDGLVNLADRDWWLSAAGAANLPSGLPYLLGDTNLDGSVNDVDLIPWLANQFTNQTAWSLGNSNDDNAVDGSDFGLWNVNRGQTSLRRSGGGPRFMTVNDPMLVLGDTNDRPFWPFGADLLGHDLHEHEGQFVVPPVKVDRLPLSRTTLLRQDGGMVADVQRTESVTPNVELKSMARKRTLDTERLSSAREDRRVGPARLWHNTRVDRAFASLAQLPVNGARTTRLGPSL